MIGALGTMASFNEINNEWSMLCQECPECWTMDDLQLAAELGKTLLERNKDLEITLKHHQNIIEDNNQEIEYLTKQTIALKEVNDSRLRIYEQLEVNIQDLERANHRLAVENSVDKKLIKNLTSNVETLEARCEELQSGIEDLRTQVDALRRRENGRNGLGLGAGPGKGLNGRRENSCTRLIDVVDGTGECCGKDNLAVQNDKAHSCTSPSPLRLADKSQETQTTPNRELPPANEVVDNAMEQIELLMSQLRESRDQYSLDQHRIMELEEQLTALNDQNRVLEKRLMRSKEGKDADGGKTMHEEFTTLEEVRQGQLCQRCLRTVENGNGDCDLSSLCDAGLEDDDHSMIDALTSATSAAASGITPNQHRHRTSFTIEVQEYAKNSPPQVNLYKELVEKYEALLELHRSAIPISRQDDLQTSGEFSANTSANLNMKDTDDESGQGDSLQPEKQSKQLSQTPTDFSEAETSSSGFADETSNKGTQTSLTDHQEDQVNKIYDSRFKANPEYKELFRDIFNTLKKDSEKEVHEIKEDVKEKLQDFTNTFDNMTDDSRSVLSCCTMSDVSVSQMEPLTVIEQNAAKKPERVLTPYIRQPLEYISVAVNARKRSSSRRNKNKLQQERSDSPMTHIVGSPKVTYANRPNSSQRKRQSTSNKGTPEKVPEASNNTENVAWNGNSLQFFSRNAPSPTPSQGSCKSGKEIEFKPSQASHDLHALKKLDKSYAEVLKNANRRGNGQRRPKYNS